MLKVGIGIYVSFGMRRKQLVSLVNRVPPHMSVV